MNEYSWALMKKISTLPFISTGFNLVMGRPHSMPTWDQRMELAKKLGFAPKVILDGGAFRGRWSKTVSGIFPGAQIVVVEPNPTVQKIIASNLSGIRPSPKVVNVALGESQGSATLNFWQGQDTDAGASLLGHVSGQAGHAVQVAVDTLDNIAGRLQLQPDLLKLDLQGAELPALQGAKQVLKHAEVVIVEFGCLDAYIGRTSPRDLHQIMYDNDYCLWDIVDLGYRPYDGAMCSGDFIFVKNSSVLRSHKGWK